MSNRNLGEMQQDGMFSLGMHDYGEAGGIGHASDNGYECPRKSMAGFTFFFQDLLLQNGPVMILDSRKMRNFYRTSP